MTNIHLDGIILGFSRRRKQRNARTLFVTGLALAMLTVAIAGFAPSIIRTAGRRAPLSLLAAAHGIVFFSRLGIFLVQGRLVATGHTALHRRLGGAANVVLASWRSING